MTKRILLVDDEPWGVAWVRDLGRSLGAVVHIADSAGKALDWLRTEVYDLIILDLKIELVEDKPRGVTMKDVASDWTGLFILNRLKTDAAYVHNKRARLICYSAWLDGDVSVRVASLGAERISKSESARLRQTVRSVLNSTDPARSTTVKVGESRRSAARSSRTPTVATGRKGSAKKSKSTKRARPSPGKPSGSQPNDARRTE